MRKNICYASCIMNYFVFLHQQIMILLYLMTKFFIYLALSLSALSVNAQTTAARMFESMPDSLCPFFNISVRKQMVESALEGKKDSVNNILNSKSIITWVSDDYICVQTSRSASLQLRILSRYDSSSILCFVRTVYAPEPESIWTFYDLQWNRLDGSFGLPNLEEVLVDKGGIVNILSRFTCCPDTIDYDHYMELRSFLDPVMLHGSFSFDEPVLTIGLSTPMLGRDDRNDVEAILLQRKFKWNGEIFKEY